jgi:septum formation protein
MISLPFQLVLASGSPRRKELLGILNLPFEVVVSDVDESFDPALLPIEVPGILAERKAREVRMLRPDAIILAADTVVDLGGKILNKPTDLEEAAAMLQSLSGKMHCVHTAYCINSPGRIYTRTDTAMVHFRQITKEEIDWYLQEGKPLDKAGAYGIQEWIGLVAVDRLDGSYFTVMGLPTHLLWQDLVDLTKTEPGSR